MQQVRTSGLAIAGFICSFVCSLLGLILSILGLNEINRSNGTLGGKGLAIAGIAISVTMSALVVIASVALPAFLDYQHKTKQSPAVLQLNKLGKYAKTAFITDGKFPVGSTGLTPPQACCAGPAAKCPADPKQWQQPVWQELDFRIDEPDYFQYSYASTDGKTAEIDAVGDLDCDGIMITYRLLLDSANGNATGTIIEPPPDSD